MDLFESLPPEGPAEYIVCGSRTYRLRETTFRKKPAIVISWVEPGRTGVIGGYHADHQAAERAIDIVEETRNG